jgi:hypothetical protein
MLKLATALMGAAVCPIEIDGVRARLASAMMLVEMK